jgi:pimeloyl-ACP methyl ester carboxylesterase
MVQHFHRLVKQQWKLSKFHILGHSFGGILAYEYLLMMQQQHMESGCQSVILASAPTSSLLIQDESKRLYRELAGFSEEEEDDDDDPASKEQHLEAFRQTHECRLAQTPLALMDALAQAGGPTSWRGIQAISDYKATQPITNMPSLVLVGEYNFCTVPCIEGWSDLIVDPAPQQKTLTICSHYGMLEDERTSIRNGHFGVLATTRAKVKYSKPSYHSDGTYYEYV